MLTDISMCVNDCVICPRTRIKSLKNRPDLSIIFVDYSLMTILSVDINFMRKGFDYFIYFLDALYKIINFILVIPMKSRTVNIIAKVLIHRVLCIIGPPKLQIVNKDLGLTGETIKFILQGINCQMKMISLFNHGSLRTERHI